MAADRVEDLENFTIMKCHATCPHPLEAKATTCTASNQGAPIPRYDSVWSSLLPLWQYSDLANIYVYLDDLITVLQFRPTDRWKIIHHLLNQVYRVLLPITYVVANCRKPMSLNKLRQVNSTWSTHKVTLRWYLETTHQILTLPYKHMDKVHKVLFTARPKSSQ